MSTPQEPFRFNGWRIHVLEGYGAFYRTDDPAEIPALVMDFYCSICAREHNGKSHDGEANCEHKSLFRFAAACLNDADDATYYRELADLQRMAAVGR